MASVPEPMQISPMPVIDPDLDVYDRAAVVKSRDAFFMEQTVRHKEIGVLRDKMRWCYRREGVNHLENCRHINQQYLDLMREMRAGGIQPFRINGPAKKSEQAAEEEH